MPAEEERHFQVASVGLPRNQICRPSVMSRAILLLQRPCLHRPYGRLDGETASRLISNRHSKK